MRESARVLGLGELADEGPRLDYRNLIGVSDEAKLKCKPVRTGCRKFVDGRRVLTAGHSFLAAFLALRDSNVANP